MPEQIRPFFSNKSFSYLQREELIIGAWSVALNICIPRGTLFIVRASTAVIVS